MKTFKIIFIFFLFQFIPIALNANEKDVINNIKINDNNNLLLSLNNSRDNSIQLSDNNIINDNLNKKYLKKAKGYLGVGIVGLTLLSLPVMIVLGETLIPYLITRSMWADPFSLTYICFMSVTVSGILPVFLTAFGFYNYNYYKRLKALDPFISYNIKKETITLGLNLKL